MRWTVRHWRLDFVAVLALILLNLLAVVYLLLFDQLALSYGRVENLLTLTVIHLVVLATLALLVRGLLGKFSVWPRRGVLLLAAAEVAIYLNYFGWAVTNGGWLNRLSSLAMPTILAVSGVVIALSPAKGKLA